MQNVFEVAVQGIQGNNLCSTDGGTGTVVGVFAPLHSSQ